MLFDNVLHTVLQEPVEGGDLLRDETVLLKVGVNDCPGVFVLYLSVQKLLLELGIKCLLFNHHIY